MEMYSPRVESDKVERLFKLKQKFLEDGHKTNMVKLVDAALERYLVEKEKEFMLREEVDHYD